MAAKAENVTAPAIIRIESSLKNRVSVRPPYVVAVTVREQTGYMAGGYARRAEVG
jgi:hypothetical protein